MSFVGRKRGQVLLVHNEREAGSARVRQREVHRFASPEELKDVLTPTGWTRWCRALSWRENEIEFDWPAISGAPQIPRFAVQHVFSSTEPRPRPVSWTGLAPTDPFVLQQEEAKRMLDENVLRRALLAFAR